MKKFTGILLAFLTLLLWTAFPAWADETVYLYTAEDLMEFSENCRYDTWSADKTVVLCNDLSLSGVDDFVIPSFGGTFDGGGHRIQDLSIGGSGSPAGFFGEIREGGVVKDLTVEGNIRPAGIAEDIGGIAGINRGTIENCVFYGTVAGNRRVGGIAGTNAVTGRISSSTAGGGVFGSRMTGGVAGCNHGTLYFCSGSAYVNTRSIDPGLSVSDLSLDLNVFADLGKLMSLDTYNVANDTGGIAGYSDGVIAGCLNNGTVGYQHIGYNVGGIAGRSRGLITGARNNGTVYGRKDVGGITGMAEPFVSVDLTEDQLQEIQDELHSLNEMVEKATADADRTSASVEAEMKQLTDQINAATGHADTLSGRLKDYADSTGAEANRGSEMLDTSINDLYHVVSTLEDSTGHLEDSTAGIREAIREVQTDTADPYTLAELNTALENNERAVSILNAGNAKIREGREIISAASTPGSDAGALDRLEQIRQGNALIREGLDILRNGRGAESGDTGGLVSYMSAASEHLGRTDLKLNTNAASDVERSLRDLRTGMDDLNTAMSETERLLSYLEGEDPLYLAPISPEISDSADALYGSMQQISDSLSSMSTNANANTGTLTSDLRQINDQFRKVSDLVIDRIYDTGEQTGEDLIQDASDLTDPSELRSGKLYLCRNSGYIYGDLNTGGITGSMAVFDELDPENDNSRDLSSMYHKRYELKCVLLSCVNSGEVISRRSNAGGICGFGQLGLISDCVSDGPVTVENGDYAGGIAGSSDNILRRCYAKVTLSGERYLGGILGGALSSTEEARGIDTVINDNVIVERCTAIPQIEKGEQYLGAIAGIERGVFIDNVFVSDDLAGVNGLSREGLAIPVSYRELYASDPQLPQELKEFRLIYKTEDAVVQTVRFAYGDEFPADTVPEIPAKEGCFARWDTKAEGILTNDTVVRAVYTPYVTALRSVPTRSESRPVFFAEGNYDDLAALEAEPALFPFSKEHGGIWQTLQNYNREILEQWHLEVPEDLDGKQEHRIRYLLPTGAGSRNDLYMRTGADPGEAASWEKLQPEKEGSYLCFTIPGNTADITVLSARTPLWIWIVPGLLLAAILVLILRDIYVRKTVRETPDQTPAPAGGKEAERRKPPLRTRLRRHAIAILALVLALGGFTAYIVQRAPGVADSMGLYLMLRNYFERSDIEMDLSIQADLGEDSFHTDVSMYTTADSGKKVTAVNWQGVPLYYCDGMMILENGKAYKVDSDLPDFGNITGLTFPLFRTVKISSSELNDVRTYHAEATGDNAARILRTLVPGFSSGLPEDTAVDVDLVMTDADLSSITFRWMGENHVEANMYFHSSTTPHTVPALVKSAIRNADAANIGVLGEDFKRVFASFTELTTRDPVSADISVQASCGPFVVNDAFSYSRTDYNGTPISGILRESGNSEKKEGTVLYAANGRICTEGGLAAGTGAYGGYLSDTWHLLEMAYTACMKGDLSHTEENGNHVYRVDLDADAIRALTDMIVPEAGSLPLDLTEGRVQVTISDQGKDPGTGAERFAGARIQSVSLSAGGDTKVAVVSIPVSMNADIRFTRNTELPEIPEEVLRQLGTEETKE